MFSLLIDQKNCIKQSTHFIVEFDTQVTFLLSSKIFDKIVYLEIIIIMVFITIS